MGAGRVKKNEDQLLLALACGATVDAAAKQCGLTDRTIYRRLAEPAFRGRLQALRADMGRRAAGLLTAAAGEAVRTLLSLQKDSARPRCDLVRRGPFWNSGSRCASCRTWKRGSRNSSTGPGSPRVATTYEPREPRAQARTPDPGAARVRGRAG
ncbi:Uncultured bacterium genome assembly Metasoil_fosmids_resub OS=uncultured bacterium PE=4 SV=1 [Gemmata massiliana]|uniref:Uncharacterized protein n=1 Tax=Gemmata massiliana TaxID=1210884 RepID=A0A6P2CZA9_9BACT|nr:hypothetical protein [Gemmata massiliana]VTR92492.1 Uncultured bacterium genome assembly Metasoil_fosmids_resub OS=uncultured bacterium PE=4 SV=1 [Gemmata massiliana]